jgi:restriction system protein
MGVKSREQIGEIVKETLGVEKPGAIPVYTGQLYALRSRIQVGDLIVLPLKTTWQVAFGIATSTYEYLENESDISRRHVLHVDWKRADVPRTAIKQDLLNMLGSALTVFQCQRNDAPWRLQQIMETGQDPGSRAQVPEGLVGDAQETSHPDLEEYGLNRIQSLIQENFANHDLTRLVEAILTCEGFTCEKKPPGADGGVDILAGQGPLGLDSPRLVVQVKSESSSVGDPVVQTLQGALQRFKGDQALLVAWGGVTNQAAKYLETTKFSIKVWQSRDVIEAILRNYAKLPEDIRSDLPLKQVWIPVDSDT